MSVKILTGDVFEMLASMPDESVDCVVTSPPYWGLRSYLKDDHPDKHREIGLERTLGEHLDVMVRVFDAVRRVMKPEGTLWLNYGDCYATKPNGKSAAAYKADKSDDRTFRDKPFSTVGPVYGHLDREYEKTPRGGKTNNLGQLASQSGPRVVGVGMLKPKDLCMIPNRLAIALQDAGWWVRSEIVWGKPNPMPDSSGKYRPSTAHEKIFLLTKSAKSFYDSEAVRMPCAGDENSNGYPGSDGDGVRKRTSVGNNRRGYKMPDGWDTAPGGHGNHHRNGREKGKPSGKQQATSDASEGLSAGRRYSGFNDRWNADEDEGKVRDTRLLRNYEPDISAIIPPEVWNIATAAFAGAHFATFPPALVVPCILAGCPVGGTVLDPFGGAGTTGLVADRLQRNAVLIELNEESVDIADDRLSRDRGGLLDAMS